MTSVLYGGGLNYQASNPLRIEIQRLQADVASVRKAIDTVTVENNLLKAKVAVLERSAAAAAAPKAAPAAAAGAGGGAGASASGGSE
jgi:hypothetical protein